jgi:peptidoglycan/LPS O-acetylase OafA/YrhL
MFILSVLSVRFRNMQITLFLAVFLAILPITCYYRTMCGKDIQGQFNSKRNSLNFIRLLLATAVIISHAYALGGYGSEPLILGNTLGGWGVLGFFCISGYLIASSREKHRLGSYLLQRIARIVPALLICHLAIVLLFAPAAQIINTGGIDGYLSTSPTPIDYLLKNLTPSLKIEVYGIGDTLSKVPFTNSWCGPLYTLYYEFTCYLIIGFLMILPAFRKPWALFALWAVFVIAQFNTDLILHYTNMAGMDVLLRLTPFFFGGSLLYSLRDRIKLVWWVAVIFTFLIILLMSFTPVRGWNGTAIVAPFITYVLLWISNALPLGRLGDLTRKHDISYGVYIYGFAVQQLLEVLFVQGILPTPPVYLDIIATLIITMILAIISWITIEKPALAFSKKRLFTENHSNGM